MPSRRELLAAATGSLALTAGCAGRLGSPDVVPCPETTTSGGDLLVEDEPARTWRLGERVTDPEPAYKPRYVAVANFGVERDVSIVVTRDDADGPVFDRAVTIDAREYVAVALVEPDVWTVAVTLPSGVTKSHTVTRFDCNSYSYGVAVRCDGRVTTFGGTSLVACPDYPVNESGTPSARDGPAVDNP